MLDPYMVLGVGKYDDDQTVKKAYRQLSKQYHPDNNLNNPNKDAAEETFKKIQQAYEQIMHERSLGIGGPDDLRRKESSQAGSGSSYTGSSWSSSGNTAYSRDKYTRETATKDRYTNGFWNNTGFGNNSSNNSSSGSSSYSANSGGSGYNSSSTNFNNSGSYNSNSSNSNSSYNSGNNGYYSNNYNNNTYNNSSYNNNYSNNSYSNNGYYSGSGYDQSNTGSYAGYGYYSGQNQQFNEDADGMLGTVANKLNSRKFYDAWDILNSMNTRNDVWYYYSAIANLGLGNSITALNHARTAKAMQPGRPEYDELINGIQSGAIHYQGRSDMFVPQKANTGNTCLKVGIAMIFMNLFCGGGGIMIPLCC